MSIRISSTGSLYTCCTWKRLLTKWALWNTSAAVSIIDEWRYNLITSGLRNGSRQRTLASVSVPVGQECPYLSVAQTCLVKAYMRTDIGSIEIETAVKLTVALIGITTNFVTV